MDVYNRKGLQLALSYRPLEEYERLLAEHTYQEDEIAKSLNV